MNDVTMTSMTSMAMPVVGCDIVEVARIRAVLESREGARERVFSAAERADAERGGVAPDSDLAMERLAARFAGKEAVRKALGGRGPWLNDIEVRSGSRGAPEVWVAGHPTAFACSLSHDAGLAMAVVVGTAAVRASVIAAYEG
jgi:holo-[acyl-carrier protein] synthase